jgi:hypothetical protein
MARTATLIGILLSLGEEEGAGVHVLWKLKMACRMHSFSRDGQLQATANTSCWHEWFVLYMI